MEGILDGEVFREETRYQALGVWMEVFSLVLVTFIFDAELQTFTQLADPAVVVRGFISCLHRLSSSKFKQVDDVHKNIRFLDSDEFFLI